MKKLLTLAEVKEKLSEIGMVLYKDNETSELQVYPKGDERGDMSTHFTSFRFKPDQDDLEDALRIGLDMARRLKLRRNPKFSTFKEIKDELENYGIGLIKTKYGIGPVNSEDFHQFQIYEIGNKSNGENYYSIGNTDRDLKSAFDAGLKLAKKLGHKRIPYVEKRQNPKCKTIEVKRKIKILGKSRVVKVKRKICNPKKHT